MSINGTHAESTYHGCLSSLLNDDESDSVHILFRCRHMTTSRSILEARAIGKVVLWDITLPGLRTEELKKRYPPCLASVSLEHKEMKMSHGEWVFGCWANCRFLFQVCLPLTIVRIAGILVSYSQSLENLSAMATFLLWLRLLIGLALVLRLGHWTGTEEFPDFIGKVDIKGNVFFLEILTAKLRFDAPCIPFLLESRLLLWSRKLYDIPRLHGRFVYADHSMPFILINRLSIQQKISPLFLFFPLQSKTLLCLHKISYSHSFILSSILHMLNIIQ